MASSSSASLMHQKGERIAKREKYTHRRSSLKSLKSSVNSSTASTSSIKLSFPQSDKNSQALSRTEQSMLEKQLAKLENAKHCLLFSSGQAANTTVLFLNSGGDCVVLSEEISKETSNILEFLEIIGLQYVFVDMTNLDAVKKVIKSNTKMVLLETPSSLTLKIPDIREVAKVAKKINPDILIVVDNTPMTCYFQRPIPLGADIVTMSLTKFIVEGELGYVCTNHEAVFEKLRCVRSTVGSLPNNNVCKLAVRSLQTLPLRMEKHMANAIKIVRYLESSPAVKKVIHPFLELHPQHDVARKQSHSFSGLISFVLHGGESEAQKFIEKLKLFKLNTVAGSIISSACIPTESRDVCSRQQKFSRNFMRLSIGIENSEELINDLKEAFDAAFEEPLSDV